MGAGLAAPGVDPTGGDPVAAPGEDPGDDPGDDPAAAALHRRRVRAARRGRMRRVGGRAARQALNGTSKDTMKLVDEAAQCLLSRCFATFHETF